MEVIQFLLVFFSLGTVGLADLLGIPTVPFTTSSDANFDIKYVKSITVDSQYASTTDEDGWTLIPPTLYEFAQTFADDLRGTAGCEASAAHGDQCGSHDIFLTIGNNSDFVDVAGRWTSEAYTLEVTENSITITGASPLGVWWGTRTVLQQAVLNNGKLAVGSGTDAPGWNTRGIFVSTCC